MSLQTSWFTFEIGWFTLVVVCVLLAIFFAMKAAKRRKQKVLAEEGKHQHVELGQVLSEKVKKEKVIVPTIRVTGPIISSLRGLPSIAGDFSTAADRFVSKLEKFREAENIAAVIVEFNTPGGSVPGSDLIRDAIEECCKVKPVFAYIGDVSASGGVWAMVSAKEIYAQPGALIGSIGVLGPTLLKYQKVTRMYGFLGRGIAAEEISGKVLFAGAGKALGHPFAEDDPEAEKKFQGVLNTTHKKFLNHVISARKLCSEKAGELASLGAAIFDTDMAERLGLINGTMPRHQFETYVAEVLGKKSEQCEFPIVRESARSRFSFAFGSQFLQDFLEERASQAIERQLLKEPQLLMWPRGFTHAW